MWGYRLNTDRRSDAPSRRPRQCNTDHRRKTSDALQVTHVGVLDVEAGGFHSSEACLNLPSLFVSGNGLFGAVITNQNLQFRQPSEFFSKALEI